MIIVVNRGGETIFPLPNISETSQDTEQAYGIKWIELG